jgi:hypothetical protein
MRNADKTVRINQTKGMGLPLTQREGFIAEFDSLVRVAELPKGPRRVCEANYPRIKTVAKDERPMALGIVERDRTFEMFPCRYKVTDPVGGHSPSQLRVYQWRLIVRALRPPQMLFSNFICFP